MGGNGAGFSHRGTGIVRGPGTSAAAAVAAFRNHGINSGFEVVIGGAGTSHTVAITDLGHVETFVPGDVDTALDQVTILSHGFTTAEEVRVASDTTLPGGLAAETQYFVRAVSSDIIAFYPTSGDASADTNRINLTTTGTGNHAVALFVNTPQNSIWPGFQLHLNGAVAAVSTQEGSNPNANSLRSAEVDVADMEGGVAKPVKFRQPWGGLIDSVNQYIEHKVGDLRTKVAVMSMDVRNTVSATAIRLQIVQDGSGTGTAESAYHQNLDVYERLFVVLEIPDDATEVIFQVLIEEAGVYEFDNLMIAPFDLAPTELAYEPSDFGPLCSPRIGTGSADLNLTGTTSLIKTGSGTPSPDVDLNAVRPHWATDLQIMAESVGGPSGQSIEIRASGDAAFHHRLTNASVDMSETLRLPMGVDSQLEIQNSNAGISADLFLRRWFGECVK